MSRALLAVLVLPAALAAAIFAAVACQTVPVGQGCSDIPGDGCPIDRGGSCDDPTCSAIYDCNDGQWVLAQVCPVSDAGPVEAGPIVDGGPDFDGGPCVPVVVDGGGPGADCTPELEGPFDCDVAAAACYGTACITGCSDFFFCSAGPCPGGTAPCWIDVAYCTDEGQLVITSP